jgi:CHAT domain-containing protein
MSGGEGLMGLQRAFQLAGARATVSSLWKVDDRATQALVAEFYTNLWQRKLPKLAALREAQLAMLSRYDLRSGQLRSRGLEAVDPAGPAGKSGPLPPFYWAAFSLAGDWR